MKLRLLAAAAAVILAAGGVGVALASASQKDDSPVQWCFTYPDGSQHTIGYGDLFNFAGSGQLLPIGEVKLAVQNGGDLWISAGSGGTIYFTVDPDTPPSTGTQLPNGDTIVAQQHYHVTDGVCAGQPPSTTPPPVGSYPSSTTTATTTETTTTSTSSIVTPLPSNQAYICESNSQTNPSVETKKHAKKLWDKGNWIPYATTVAIGSTKIGGGLSLICDPLKHHLKFTVGKWVNDIGTRVGFLDLRQYPVVIGAAT